MPHRETLSTYRLEAVTEAGHPREVDALGDLLARNLTWVGPFVIFLSSLPIGKPPGLTYASDAFVGACRDDGARDAVQLLDELYRDVQDGYLFSQMQGAVLERFVWHLLTERFPERLAACRLLIDGEPGEPDFKFDAGTRTHPHGVGLEAKNSAHALNPHPSRRAVMKAKVDWVVQTRVRTTAQFAGVFVTWSPETLFRETLTEIAGEKQGLTAVIFGRESLTKIPTALTTLEKDLRRSVSAS